MFITAALTVAMALVVWFKTDAFVSWLTLVKLDRFFHIVDYNVFTSGCDEQSFLTYPQFLYEYYPTFITKLLNCPTCTSVWLAFIACIVFPPFKACLAVAFVGLCCYLLFNKLVVSITNDEPKAIISNHRR